MRGLQDLSPEEGLGLGGQEVQGHPSEKGHRVGNLPVLEEGPTEELLHPTLLSALGCSSPEINWPLLGEVGGGA